MTPTLRRFFTLASFVALTSALVLVAGVRDAAAAPRWVDRPMTLPRLVFAGDVGLGIGHYDPTPGASQTGVGINLEGGFGVTDRIELGIRTGIRPGDFGFRTAAGDVYGRALWTENYWYGTATVANPELRIRGALLRTDLLELGLDGRVMVPVDGGNAGLMFGVPLAFHVGDMLRIDTGAYLPLSFTDPATAGLSVPGYFWFQTTDRLWLGPMAALRFFNNGFLADDVALLAGFGLGYQFASWLDLKTQIYWPQLNGNNGLENLGVGVGLQMRIE